MEALWELRRDSIASKNRLSRLSENRQAGDYREVPRSIDAHHLPITNAYHTPLIGGKALETANREQNGRHFEESVSMSMEDIVDDTDQSKTLSTVADLIAEAKVSNSILDKVEKKILDAKKSSKQATTLSTSSTIKEMNSETETARTLLAECKEKLTIFHDKLPLYKDAKGKYYEKMIIKHQIAKLSNFVDELNEIQLSASNNLKKNLRHQIKAANSSMEEQDMDELLAKGDFQKVFQSDALKADQLKDLTDRTEVLGELMEKMQKLYQLSLMIQTMTNENDEMLDEIDDAVQTVDGDVKVGVENLKTARQYQVSRYKYILIAVAVIILIIIIVCVAVFV